jgi:hypothetical protein
MLVIFAKNLNMSCFIQVELESKNFQEKYGKEKPVYLEGPSLLACTGVFYTW